MESLPTIRSSLCPFQCVSLVNLRDMSSFVMPHLSESGDADLKFNYRVPQKDGQKKPKDPSKNLGPSNLASRPRTTRYNTVKIKPGGVGSAHKHAQESPDEPRHASPSPAPQGGVGAGLLSSAGKDAKDGVIAVQAGYGTMGVTPPQSKGRDR